MADQVMRLPMSADTVFEVGDTVKLRSDGHLMTVVSVAEDSITCDWSVRGDVKSKSFPVAALKKAVSDGFDLEQLTMGAMARLEAERSGAVVDAEPKCLS